MRSKSGINRAEIGWAVGFCTKFGQNVGLLCEYQQSLGAENRG